MLFHQYCVTRCYRNRLCYQPKATLRNYVTISKPCGGVEDCLGMVHLAFFLLDKVLKNPQLSVTGIRSQATFGRCQLLASHLTTLDNGFLVRGLNCGQWSAELIAKSSDPTCLVRLCHTLVH